MWTWHFFFAFTNLTWPATKRVQHLRFNLHLCLDLSQLVSLLYWLQWEQLACKYLPVTAVSAATVKPLRKHRRAIETPPTPRMHHKDFLFTCAFIFLLFTLSPAFRSQNKLTGSFKHKLGTRHPNVALSAVIGIQFVRWMKLCALSNHTGSLHLQKFNSLDTLDFFWQFMKKVI